MSKAHHCRQEMGSEIQSVVSAQSAKACWGNPAGLAMLEQTERTTQNMLDRLALLEAEFPKSRAFEAEVQKWRAAYQHSLAIRDHF